MKMKGCLIVLGWLLLAANLFGADEILNFAKTNLALDLTTVPFGIELKNHTEFKKLSGVNVQLTNYQEVSWYEKTPSPPVYSNGVLYGSTPSKNVRYGFKEGRLVAVEIIRVGWGNEQLHEQLVKIHAAFRQLPGKKNSFRDDGHFRVNYVSMCNPNEDLVAYIYIRKVEAF